LEKIVAIKLKEIEALSERKLEVPKGGTLRANFRKALEEGRGKRGIGLICEYKRASPSLGDIELKLTPEEAAAAYAKSDCLSVLTEREFFKGDISYLSRMGPLPLLRKDFIIHPLQVVETIMTKASAVLIMLSLPLDDHELIGLKELARKFGILPVVEVSNEEELKRARHLGSELIQVNARNFKTMEVDIHNNLKLIEKYPPRGGEFFISASGVKGGKDLKNLKDAGYGAALIGTSLMKGGEPEKKLERILEELEAC
jgi:indole-3-glycerol phosphate synthase